MDQNIAASWLTARLQLSIVFLEMFSTDVLSKILVNRVRMPLTMPIHKSDKTDVKAIGLDPDRIRVSANVGFGF